MEKFTDVVEASLDGQYIRFGDIIKQTKLTTSYRAFDTKDGVEVLWHIVQLVVYPEPVQQRLISNIKRIKTLQDKTIVSFRDMWMEDEPKFINIITIGLDSLTKFMAKAVTLRWRIVKKWCTQILRSLQFLHEQSPPLVHCNLNCSRIYMDGGTGALALGDLWLCDVLLMEEEGSGNAVSQLYDVLCCLGVGAEGEQNLQLPSKCIDPQARNFHSLGLCVIEMITREEFGECCWVELRNNGASGDDPASMTSLELNPALTKVLNKINNPMAKKFILYCIGGEGIEQDGALTAQQLLSHEFLVHVPEDDDLEVSISPSKLSPTAKTQPSVVTVSPNSPRSPDASLAHAAAAMAAIVSPCADPESGVGVAANLLPTSDTIPLADTLPLVSVECSVPPIGDTPAHEIQLQMIVGYKDSVRKEVNFVFNSLTDNVNTVATEMWQELKMDISVELLAMEIEKALSLKSSQPTVAPVHSNSIPVSGERPSTGEDDQISPTASVERIAAAEDFTSTVTMSTADVSAVAEVTAFPVNSISGTEGTGGTTSNPNPNPGGLTPRGGRMVTSNSASSSNSSLVALVPAILESCEPALEPVAAAPEDDEDYIMEMEKLEKECRASKRVFEQRILKHKLIQEKCQKDLDVLESEHQSKIIEVERLLSTAIKKNEDELQKLRSEMISKLQSVQAEQLAKAEQCNSNNSSKGGAGGSDSGAKKHVQQHGSDSNLAGMIGENRDSLTRDSMTHTDESHPKGEVTGSRMMSNTQSHGKLIDDGRMFDMSSSSTVDDPQNFFL